MSKIGDSIWNNGFEIHVVYNRYGYYYGHGWLCVIDEIIDNDIFENVCGGDIESIDAVEEIRRNEMESPRSVFVALADCPIQAVKKCSEKYKKVWL